MTTQFDRPLVGYRFADTFYGDTLQDVALRELGDASRWLELIAYNNLLPPYLVDDPQLARAGVIVTGRPILVPAPGRRTDHIDVDSALGTDIQMGPGGDLLTDGRDFVLVSGAPNLVQALRNRVNSDRGDLPYHPGYGGDVRRLIGVVNGPTKGLIGARASRTTVLQDPRVTHVRSADAREAGDVINITVDCETVAGRSTSVSVPVVA